MLVELYTMLRKEFLYDEFIYCCTNKKDTDN